MRRIVVMADVSMQFRDAGLIRGKRLFKISVWFVLAQNKPCGFFVKSEQVFLNRKERFMSLSNGSDDLFKHFDDQLGGRLSRTVQDLLKMSPAELDAAKGYRMNAEFFWKSFEASVDLVVSDGWSKWLSMRETVRDEVAELLADTPEDLKKVKKELKKRRDKNFKDMLALPLLKSPEGPNFAGHLANLDPRYEEERKARTEKVRADVLKRRPQIEVSFILLKVLSEALEKV